MTVSGLFDSAPAAAGASVPAVAGRAKRARRGATKAPHALAGALPAPSPGTYRLTYEARPWTLNVERQGNQWKRAKLVAEWRPAFRDLAHSARIPACQAITVTARPELRDAGGVPDTAACIGAAKAGIDGLIDAGVLEDDGPLQVRRLTFEAPIITGRDALNLDVEVLR